MSDRTEQSFAIEWHDSGREPRCAPNPLFPNGIDINLATQGQPWCTTMVPYPAKRCGSYTVRCKVCGYSVAVTTAGRPDDPRSVTMPCAIAGPVQ